ARSFQTSLAVALAVDAHVSPEVCQCGARDLVRYPSLPMVPARVRERCDEDVDEKEWVHTRNGVRRRKPWRRVEAADRRYQRGNTTLEQPPGIGFSIWIRPAGNNRGN